jgi:CrcB protein
MFAYLWVALGGALGSVTRFWMSGAIASRFGETFPVGTLAINFLGSFLIGLVAGLNAPEGRGMISPGMQQFVMIGFCGGYTTFSSFSLQTLKLMQDREWLYAGGNVLLSVTLCLLGVWLGYALASAIHSRGA